MANYASHVLTINQEIGQLSWNTGPSQQNPSKCQCRLPSLEFIAANITLNKPHRFLSKQQNNKPTKVIEGFLVDLKFAEGSDDALKIL